MELPVRLKQLGDILDLGISLGNAFGESMEDGVLSYSDAFNFATPLMKIAPAIDGGLDGLQEAWDADEADRELLKAYFKEKFDLPQDDIEQRIEEALVFVFSLIGYLKTWMG